MADPKKKVEVDDDGNPITTSTNKIEVDEDGNPIRVTSGSHVDPVMQSRLEAARGVAPYDDNPEHAPKPSPMMSGLNRMAHPSSVGDFLSYVAPTLGTELWTPGVRMAKTALRFAAAEPKTPGVIGSVTGAVRGALRGLSREAAGVKPWIFTKQVEQESPRLVKAGTDVPVDLPVGRSRVARPPGTPQQVGEFRDSIEAKIGKAVGEAGVDARTTKVGDLDKAIEAEKRLAADKRIASGRRETTAVRAEQTADTQETARLARQEKFNAKATEEAANAERIAREREGLTPGDYTVRESVSAPLPGGGKQSMGRTFKQAEEVVDTGDADLLKQFGGNQAALDRFKAQQAGSEVAKPAIRIVPKKVGVKVAEYSHTSTDGLPRFNVEGSDVTADVARSRGYDVGATPEGAGRESSTVARDAAQARQAVRITPPPTPAVGGTLTPQQAIVIQEKLGLKFPPKTLTAKGREVLDAIAEMRRVEGAEHTAKKFGQTRIDVSLLDPGEAGLMPAGGGTRKAGMADIDARIAAQFGDNPTKAELTEYLRRSPNANPALINYLNALIERAR